MSDLSHVARVAWLVVRTPRCFAIARRAIRDYGAEQRTSELTAAVRAVSALRPGVVIEIGSRTGGTLYAWSAVSAHNALIVSVDLDGLPPGRPIVREAQQVAALRGDSHDPNTHARVCDALGQREADFLFIDGDHSYEGVRQDFFTFAPLVRAGGLVGLHDIVDQPGRSDCDVWRFWEELRGEWPTRTCVDPHGRRDGGMGIGLVRVTEAGRTRWRNRAI